MREAIDEGFRGTIYSNSWPLALDPYLDSIREQPGFRAMINEIEAEISLMHQNVVQAEATGNWDTLIARLDST